MTLDKLSGIRGDLVRTDTEWETWDFTSLTEALKQWVKRNPISANERDEPNRKKLFYTRDCDFKPRGVFIVETWGINQTNARKSL